MKGNGVRVLKILGRDYSIRASASEDRVLQEAAALLQERLAENRQRFPSASKDDLLVLTALNLCVPLLQQGQQLREVEERLAASVEQITRQLQD
ncbi:Cell division protein ZapA, inhibits GTPase activity of FtsZ [Azotobacter beijerinckii]|uniref:Cell division protein ZapA n=1 Tax=Azotobacter beijerinckii TaxID=170623 RepID=A0A1H6WRH1_9GAMM|nr:cell division protein ZapA [Azotobacter beijerinckii]MDV7211564.1 cell division protein ZapA [Azotobacter beijerinckii]SEJ17744.1 Cell division protein ZapA, inhibits GTPase activity of FtsZ [Azotobacter beijerinckii]SEJ20742.1 Cell division protein ZapA, inhibits GTPase activity of FtsZ [Azotobacter beijerinckii]SER45648.1 Cell division protein ZapA, inhibits GTPase activity of FtsZ [Azotobacter beijerinckii]